jgi:hypothetical protein
MDTPNKDKLHQQEAVRRVVGIAALRKLHRMVAADAVQTAADRARGRRMLLAILLLAALGLTFLLRATLFD